MEHVEDRVRKTTGNKKNKEIDKTSKQRVTTAQRKKETDERIKALEKEWDIERALELNAATLGLAGMLLGTFVSRKWMILPGVVTAFLLQHSLQGWCPPVPLFRRLGFRTRREIDREKYALKAVRGDFAGTKGNTDKSWQAVKE